METYSGNIVFYSAPVEFVKDIINGVVNSLETMGWVKTLDLDEDEVMVGLEISSKSVDIESLAAAMVGEGSALDIEGANPTTHLCSCRHIGYESDKMKFYYGRDSDGAVFSAFFPKDNPKRIKRVLKHNFIQESEPNTLEKLTAWFMESKLL